MSARILPSRAEGRRERGGGCGALDWRKKGFEIRAEADAVSAMIFIRAENAVQLTPLHWHWHCRRKCYTSSSHSLPPFHPTENMRHTLHNIRGRIIIYAHCVCLRRARRICKDSRAERSRAEQARGRKGVHYYNSLSPETWLAKPCSNYKERAPALLRLL